MKQFDDTIITNMIHSIVEMPHAVVPLIHQRMFGTKINYHYLQVEWNQTEHQDCVYQFLLTNYGHLVKALSKESLLGLFDDDAIDTGVSTYI